MIVRESSIASSARVTESVASCGPSWLPNERLTTQAALSSFERLMMYATASKTASFFPLVFTAMI
jgi:hypothetical protein